MMLDWLGEQREGRARSRRAVAAVIAEGKVRTYDMGGSTTTLRDGPGHRRGRATAGRRTSENAMKKTTTLRKAIMERRAVGAARLPRRLLRQDHRGLRLRGHPDLRLRPRRLAARQARRRPRADEGRARPDLEHRAGGEHPGDGRRRHRRRQRRQRRLDHGAADRDGRGRHEHRGPGLPEALRPHGRQGGDRRRGDGGQGQGLRRRPRSARPRLHHQRPHRRVRGGRTRRGDPPLQPVPRGRRRPGLHRRHQDPRRHREGREAGEGPALGQPDGRDLAA